jgi:integrase/recombinase XerC
MTETKQDPYIVRYLEILRTQRQLSLHSIANYQLDLAQLQAFAQTRALEHLTYHDIRRLTSQLHAQGKNPRTIARQLSCWRGFYRWLGEQIKLPANPVDGIKAPKKSLPLPKALGADDAVRLVSQMPSKLTRDYVNQAMFELLYSSGLRVSELVGLDIQDVKQAGHQSLGWVDFAQAQVHVTGKGNKQRIIPVGAPALLALQTWLEYRAQFATQKPTSDPYALFLNEQGRRMTVRMVQTRIKEHGKQLSIPANVHPHMLRHSFASHVLQSSGDLRAVQEMLGHSSIVSTQVYTALDFQHLAKVYDNTHPRAKKKNE